MHMQTKRARRRRVHSSYRLLDPLSLPLPSLYQFTIGSLARCYENHCADRLLSRGEPNPRSKTYQDAERCMLVSVALCSTVLDILMNSEADFIKEIRYLAGLMRQNCHDAWWRMERLLSKVEQGESLDTRSTSIQLSEARDELQKLMRGIESIQKLCELESDDS